MKLNLNNTISNVCVCVCFYNTNPKYLEESFLSIDNAIWFFKRYYDVPVDVYVMDDGSDNIETINMFEHIHQKYPYIKLYKHEHNTTLAVAINDLHDQMPDDALVIYIDSDDMMMYNRILIQYEIFTKYTWWWNITMCATPTCTPSHFFNQENLNILRYYRYVILNKLDDMLYDNYIMHPTIAYKINHIRQYNIKYDETLKCTQDYDFYLQLLSKNLDILLIPDAITYWRIYPDSEKPDSNRDYDGERDLILKKYFTKTLK